ncbi:MAG TPA: hypothetical protein VKQ29_09925 [Aliidongia sp.]|nr:hypothetical protein [Aliidongia sp.]
MNRTQAVIAMAGLLMGLAVAGAPAIAQSSPSAPSADQDKGMMMRNMKNGGMMMSGMMMGPEMQRKMSRMVDNCNRMMEAMNKDRTSALSNKG